MSASVIGKFAVMLIAVILASCPATYYVPNAQHVPLHQKAGDLALEGGMGYGMLHNLVSFHAHGSIAFTDQLALVGSYSMAEDDSKRINQELRTWDMGAGYFRPLWDEEIVFETYAGLGRGWGKAEDHIELRNYAFRRIFVQPAIGYSGEYLDVAVSLKASLLDYNRDDLIRYRANGIGNVHLDDGTNDFLLEPALTLRLKYRFAYLQSQTVLSNNFTRKFRSHLLLLNVSLGLRF